MVHLSRSSPFFSSRLSLVSSSSFSSFSSIYFPTRSIIASRKARVNKKSYISINQLRHKLKERDNHNHGNHGNHGIHHNRGENEFGYKYNAKEGPYCRSLASPFHASSAVQKTMQDLMYNQKIKGDNNSIEDTKSMKESITSPSSLYSTSSTSSTSSITNNNSNNANTIYDDNDTDADANTGTDDNNDNNKNSSYNRGVFKSPIISTLWAQRSKKMETDDPFLKSHSEAIAQNNGESKHLLSKLPSDSYIEIDYNFTTDYFLKQAYTNPWGFFRKGKLLEDMDALAGNIAQIHCHVDGYALPLLVTASCDKISMTYDHMHSNNHDNVNLMDFSNTAGTSEGLKDSMHTKGQQYNINHVDMKLSGQVIYTGSSSLQILLGIRKKDNIAGNDRNWMTALFTFVARDPVTNKALPINSLDISRLTEQEKQLYHQALDRVRFTKQRNQQKKMAQRFLDKLSEKKKQLLLQQQQRRNYMIASLLNSSKPLLEMPCLADPMCILLEKTTLVHNHIMQPQQRNMLDRIFGGYLMRKSFEIAFTCAYLFGGSQPEFVSLNHVDFILPVDVGDLMKLESSVLYTTVNSHSPPRLHIQVVASICKPEVQTSKVSNTFDYTFQLPEILTCKKVLPSNYSDAARIVDRILSEETNENNIKM